MSLEKFMMPRQIEAVNSSTCFTSETRVKSPSASDAARIFKGYWRTMGYIGAPMFARNIAAAVKQKAEQMI
jgi:hypothetical protein